MERKQRLAGPWLSTARRRSATAAALVVVAALAVAGLAVVRGAHAAPSGNAWAWGTNNYGTLAADPSTQPSSATPLQVGVANVVAVASGPVANDALAVDTSGALWGWGSNQANQLQAGSTNNIFTPVQLMSANVSAAAAGADFNLVLKSDGTVWAQGANASGQLGNGTTTASATPVQVDIPAGTQITAIAAGLDHGLAVDANGGLWAWGLNTLGQLGDGTTASRSTPEQINASAPSAGVKFTAVAAGDYFSLALDATGAVWAWGSDSNGQLGNGGTTNTALPAQVAGVSGATAIAAGAYHSVAIASGSVLAWGSNSAGELGNGQTADSSTPVAVAVPAGVSFTAIAAGSDQTLAIGSDGNVYAWGDDTYGEVGPNAADSCGNFGNACSTTPIVVPGVQGTSSIAAGTQFSLAMVPTSSPTPTPVPSAPAASVSATSISFGNQVHGTTSTAQSVTLTSTGNAALTVTSVTIGGANAGDFALASNTCSGQSIAVGATCSVAVTFTPTATGPRSATVSFSDNAASGSPQTVSLTGNGTYSWTGPQTALGATLPLAGSPVQLQFTMTGADAGNTGVVAHAYYAPSGSTSYQPTNPAPNTFSYSALTQTYTYTWNTLGLAPGTYSVKVDLGDGAPGYITLNLAL